MVVNKCSSFKKKENESIRKVVDSLLVCMIILSGRSMDGVSCGNGALCVACETLEGSFAQLLCGTPGWFMILLV